MTTQKDNEEKSAMAHTTEMKKATTPEQFHKAYNKAETWADADKVCKMLNEVQRTQLIEAMEIVKPYFSLDMREDFYLGILKRMSREFQEHYGEGK